MTSFTPDMNQNLTVARLRKASPEMAAALGAEAWRLLIIEREYGDDGAFTAETGITYDYSIRDIFEAPPSKLIEIFNQERKLHNGRDARGHFYYPRPDDGHTYYDFKIEVVKYDF